MAEAVVTFALEKVHDLLVEEGRSLSGVSDGVKELEKQLVEMKCLIEDTDKRRHESGTVKNCIVEIRDLADRAEDAIELYAVRVSSKRRRGVKKVLRRYACILKECHSLHQLDSEIKHVKSSLEGVTNKLLDHGVMKKSIDGDIAKKTYFEFEKGDCFVGMEKELKQLVSLIEGQEHGVISVWGMGGLGKTTIARKVYNQIKKKANCFDHFAWVCISQQFKILSVLEEALKQLAPQREEDLSSLSENELIERLHEIQRAHRCLIVIDDLWKISDWNHFKEAFLVEDLQNKVLVTTRKQNLAEAIGFSLKLGNLNMDEAWELLKNKAFPDNNNIPVNSQEKLHKIGKKMLQKCGCLPLAISLLGGVLRKKSMDDWESVLENMNEYMFKAEGDDEDDFDQYVFGGVLDLSYKELPYYLKPCFLYLGTLEEDESIDVLDLYRVWIAQGMVLGEIHGGKEGTLMDIAEIYLSELASRCIVEVEVDDIIPTENYKSCKLHNVVRKQCLLKGRNEGFGVKSLTLNLPGRNHITSLPRYLVIHVQGEVQQERDGHTKEDTYKNVRSLQVVNDMYAGIVEFPAHSIVDFRRFRMLRDLVIVGFSFPGRKLPRAITNLVHLRCLRLRACELDELPLSIRKLVYLETLDLQYSRDVRIPDVLKKMFRLKHLLLPSYIEDTIGNYRLRLDEGLDELETLMGFDSKVHELKCTTRMKNLRRLSASVHDNKSLSDIINAIATTWNKLRYCAFTIKKGCELTSEEGLMLLKQVFTCPNLHWLAIEVVQLRQLPVECTNNDMISSKLAVLSLLGCKIEDDPMWILGKLPSLGQLHLMWGSFVGEEMTCPPSSFPRLKTLRIEGLVKLREWRVETGAMPLLSELTISDCPCLEMVPDGLSRVSTLQSLKITGMPELSKRIMASGEDFHKICHVPSITIHDQDEV